MQKQLFIDAKTTQSIETKTIPDYLKYTIPNILKQICSSLRLNNSIYKSALNYFNKIIEKETKVINKVTLIAFCLLYAIRKKTHTTPMTLVEISEAFKNHGYRVNLRLIIRDECYYKKHLIHLGKDILPYSSEDYLPRLINTISEYKHLEDIIKKKCCKWSKDEYLNNLENECKAILKILSIDMRGGRSPLILTGAVIYQADLSLAEANNHKALLTQKTISEATRIKEYSLRDHYVTLLKPIFPKKR